MKRFYRIGLFSLCILLALSTVPSLSLAYAIEDRPSLSVEAEDAEEDGDTPASTGMFDTTAALGKTLLSGIWSLFSIYVPGFSFTFGQMWLGVLLASLSILVVRMIFGFGGGPRGESSRTSSTNTPKISKERRNDEF